MILTALLLAITYPIDRSYITAETDRSAAEVSACVNGAWGAQGRSDIVDTDYGRRVDFRFKNLGGTVKDPTMSLEVHDGDKRTVVLYGFGTWRGAIKNVWKQASKTCFPELKEAEVVKP